VDGASCTIGVSYFVWNTEVNGEPFRYDLWDTAGQERYKSLCPLYYRGSDAVFLVFDLTCHHSFTQIQDHWLERAREETSDQCMFVLIGNKSDFSQAPREVSVEEITRFATEQNLDYYEVSVMTGKNLQQSFHQVAAKLVAHHANKVASDDPSKGDYQDQSVDLTQETTSSDESSSTCWCGY